MVSGTETKVLEHHVRLFKGAMGPDFVFIDNNACPHRSAIVENFIEEEGIQHMEWPARSLDMNLI